MTGADSSGVDLGPLSWVLIDIQNELDDVIKSLRCQTRESTSAQPDDPHLLRLSKQQLHQTVGALQMTGHLAPAQVLRAMELTVQGFVTDPLRCTVAAVDKVERAGFAVLDCLQIMLAGKTVDAVGMFPQYRELLELTPGSRIHPADLWDQPWQWVDLPMPGGHAALVYDPVVRFQFDRDVLKLLKSADAVAAGHLHDLSLGLAQGSSARIERSFWTLSAAFFEAFALALIPNDVYAKRAASCVLLQYATLAYGEPAVSESLAHDLLFLCSQSQPVPTGQGAMTLHSVRAAWGISGRKPVDYNTVQFGRFAPTVLTQARQGIDAAKDMWSTLSHGDMSRIGQAVDAFAQLGDALHKVYAASLHITQALSLAVDASLRSGRPPDIELAMEVATSMLYLEAAFEDIDPDDGQLSERTLQLAARIHRVCHGDPSEPLDAWMEELYHRVSDRRTMGTVVDELHTRLAELERPLDQYFCSPSDKAVLRNVPTQLMQLQGVLSVLGLDQAVRAVSHMRGTVDQMLEGNPPAEAARNFESFGNNLSALGFLVDMLAYQPVLAKRLFLFDDQAGELKSLMGHHVGENNAMPLPGFESVSTTSQRAALSGDAADADLTARLTALADLEPSSSIEEFSRATADWTSSIAGTVPVPQAPEDDDDDDVSDSLVSGAGKGLLGATTIVALPLLSQSVDLANLPELDISPDSELPADCTPDAPQPGHALPPVPDLHQESALSGADDAVKVIGPLRVGLALYNVYLNEADEWSRQLASELGEWAFEPHAHIPESTVVLAHALAGSSDVVGFHSLSGMARLFESAMAHLSVHGLGTPESGAVLVAAADELRYLLHQFAAGFLRNPEPSTLDALRAIAATPLPSVAPVPTQEPEPVQFLGAPLHAGQVLLEDDEASDLLDAVDAELFPIFEEEAAELMPQLGAALRTWAQHPGDPVSKASTLRALHTLKGIARLVGAMRLGERAHGMESEVDLIGTQLPTRAAADLLLKRFDVLQATFDNLRSRDAASQAVIAQEAADAAGPVVDPSLLGLASQRTASLQAVRIRTQLLDKLVTQAGEVIITRTRIELSVSQLRSSLHDLTGNLERLRQQLRDLESQSESQMQSRLTQDKDSQQDFGPLEFDRFTRVQELTRMMIETVNDVATVQRTLQRTVQLTEDDLTAQARQTRELQRGLLRTRMVEFDGLSERLYRVVRQASKDTGKQVRLDIVGGSIEVDRGVLDRMTPAFEHLLRNSVAHGIEDAALRVQAGKSANGLITVALHHEGNDVSLSFQDDGAGLDYPRIAKRAQTLGLIEEHQTLTPDEAADLIFRPGFSTAQHVSELAGRGIGMDVVQTQVDALGGRIETHSSSGQGTTFKLVLPLTTAVTQVVMLRAGAVSIGVPSNLVELVQRASAADLSAAYERQSYSFGGEELPFFWAGALLQSSSRSDQPVSARANTIVVVHSAAQRIAMHVDEVLGNQEVVVKNLGPQLARLPGMAGITVLTSGDVVLIYNPVALATVHGESARRLQGVGMGDDAVAAAASGPTGSRASTGTPLPPLVLVVDDSITVQRVTQRLLLREGYRVVIAADGVQALERLQEERPAIMLSDIEMPRMDGFDLARTIRADAALNGLPIIMITSRIAGRHRELADRLGINHYLGKPYPEDELLRLVRSYADSDVSTG